MKLTWKTCLKVGISIFLLYLCIHYWAAVSGLLGAVLSASVPLLVGCIIAYVVNIIMTFFEKHYFLHLKTNGSCVAADPCVCWYLSFVLPLLLRWWWVWYCLNWFLVWHCLFPTHPR